MHKFILNGLIFLATVLPTLLANANEANISLQHVSSYQAQYDFFTMDKSGNNSLAGSWSDDVVIDESSVLRTVERKTLAGETDLLRSVAADKTTLAPRYLQQRFGPKLQSVFYSEYHDGALSQIFLGDAKAPARQLTTPLTGQPKETNLQGLFAVALPFTEHKNITVNSYVAGAEPRLNTMSFTVAGKEQIEIDGTVFETWKVVQPDSQWTYWVTPEFPYLIRVLHPSPDGTMLLSEITAYSKTQ